ncbi:MAG: hypothetical protein WAV56_01065 [Microgenomates group bacterium]
MNYKDQRGIIPLFFLIPFVLIATGVIGVQSGFFQNVTSGIRKFLAAPSPSNLPQQLGQWQQEPTKAATPIPTLEIKGEVQTKPYVYKQPGTKTTVPPFTVTAPTGWVKISSSGNELAHFESTEIDSEKVKAGTITTNAIITIKATDSYSSLDDFAKQYKASGSGVKGYQLVSSQTQGAGQNLEFTYEKKIGDGAIVVHELTYLFFKDGVSFLVKGYASDAAWDKHAGEIKSSLDSFGFK